MGPRRISNCVLYTTFSLCETQLRLTLRRQASNERVFHAKTCFAKAQDVVSSQALPGSLTDANNTRETRKRMRTGPGNKDTSLELIANLPRSPLRVSNCRTMAPRVRVHLLWCALACAARSAAEPPPPADQGGFAMGRRESPERPARVCVEITVAASARWRGGSPIDFHTGESSSEY